MATTLLDKQQRQLIKKFHTLLGKAGVDAAGKEAILAGYGVSSTKELSAYELLEACNALDKIANPQAHELDVWRKRVIASIFAYFNALGLQGDIERVKGTATRAAKSATFNEISLEQLRSIYSAFTKKAKTVKNVDAITREELGALRSLN